MNNFRKLQSAIESDSVTEKTIAAFIACQRQCRVYYYRLRYKNILAKCSRNALNWYPGKKRVMRLLKNTLGDFSSFSTHIEARSQDASLAQAEKYMEREFDILGSGRITLKTIDWHTDFKTGFKWEPGMFYKDYVQVNLDNKADVKIPRELSRCHHFLIYGQAYLITKDEKFTEEFLEQILDWIDNNPLMKSINWGCTMDVAIRVVNWLWALGMFVDSTLVTDAVLKKIFVSLYEHGYFIYRNPENSASCNHNHYISDLFGQIYLGIILQGAPESSIWLTKGQNELFREMRTQILPSGPTYERSTNYHRLVLELLSSAIIVLSKNGFEIPSDIWYRLEKMYEFVMYYTKPDGLVPVIGDQDDGRAHPFGMQQNIDHRYLLAIAALLFDRLDFKDKSTGYNPDCFFLLGSNSRAKFEKMGAGHFELNSKSFPDAGFYVLRNDNNYMFVNISGKSRYSEIAHGTHTHSDLLSFELAISGKTFFVDPGTYLYSADPAERMRFRTTQMHNTITIDGENQNILTERMPWDFERNALPRLIKWRSTNEADLFEGGHSGYQRLDDPVEHRRKIVFDKKYVKWEIEDSIIGKGKHQVEAHYHFDEGIDFEVRGNTVITNCSDGMNISLLFESETAFNLAKKDSWVSKHYGRRERAKVLVLSLTANCPIQVKTTIEMTKSN